MREAAVAQSVKRTAEYMTKQFWFYISQGRYFLSSRASTLAPRSWTLTTCCSVVTGDTCQKWNCHDMKQAFHLYLALSMRISGGAPPHLQISRRWINGRENISNLLQLKLAKKQKWKDDYFLFANRLVTRLAIAVLNSAIDISCRISLLQSASSWDLPKGWQSSGLLAD